MKWPVQVKIETSEYYKHDLEVWWKRLDYAFRFLGWCLMGGVIRSAAERSNDPYLRIIAGLVAGMLFFMFVRVMRFRPAITVDVLGSASRVGKVVAHVLTYLAAACVGLAGGYLYTHLTNSIFIIPTIR